MAKKEKNKERKAPLVELPSSISTLDGITRGINRENLSPQPAEQTNEEKQEEPSRRGRPKKVETEIVEATGNTEWDCFEDYIAQYHKTKKEGVPVRINRDLINFFYRLKSVMGPKVDLTNMVNAVVKLFVEKYKDHVNDLVVKDIEENN